jgi:hypothetical protein
VSDFNTPLSAIEKSSRHKTNKETSELNYTIDQMDLTNTYRIFHPNSQRIQILLSSHELSLKWIISENIKVLTNTRKLKYFPIFYQTAME